MKLDRLRHEPAALAEFFQEGLESLGALCERTWHDRLQVVAEGASAHLWNSDGRLIEKEIFFPPPGEAVPRQADHEVFPGCPLIFRMAEAMTAGGLILNRVILRPSDKYGAPAADVAERLWRLQFPTTGRWHPETNFAAGAHCSLVALVRCEIQAADQHWSLHRLAVSLPDGEPDVHLAQNLHLLDFMADGRDQGDWLATDPAAWQKHLQRALEQDLEADLDRIRHRQENQLRRELERVDDYFENYIKELAERAARSRSAESKAKLDDRRRAALAEHERRRVDQTQRHEIRIIPHIDTLLLLSEPAWKLSLLVAEHGEPHRQAALWLPRTRRWLLTE
jgi:hypothetical protein